MATRVGGESPRDDPSPTEQEQPKQDHQLSQRKKDRAPSDAHLIQPSGEWRGRTGYPERRVCTCAKNSVRHKLDDEQAAILDTSRRFLKCGKSRRRS